MSQINHIKELINIAPILSVNHIQWWLMKHESEFHNSINSSSCRKWDKWLIRNEKPFPCACSSRENDCVFIELYYELSKITKQEYSGNTEFIETSILELVLITQNEPYKRIKFLIKTD